MKTKDGRHKFKWMKYNGNNIRIDIELANIISMMWKLGINTTNCCQTHCSFNCNHKYKIIKDGELTHYKKILTKECDTYSWICFESARDIELFYNCIAINSESFPDRLSWVIFADMNNHGVIYHIGRPTINGVREKQDQWIEDGCKENNFQMQPQLTFPKKHIKLIESLLELKLSKD